jgi:putative hemolysin
LPHRYIEMRRLDRDDINARAALNKLPPLIKGYLRLGGFVGDGAVIDADFNTTDVAVVVQTDLVTGKYYKHYERDTR